MFSDEIAGTIAEHGDGTRVDAPDHTVFVRGYNAIVGTLHDSAQSIFTVFQLTNHPEKKTGGYQQDEPH